MAARTDGDTPSTDRPAPARHGREAALEALLAEIRACRICAPHLAHEPRPVLQAGPRAPILLVGQAPGRRVHETGLPFNDPSGDRLRRWLGVTREEFYDPRLFNIVPMGFCWPGTVKGKGDLPPRPECAATWRRRLIAALPEPELVLLIGRYAIAWHLGEEALADGVSGAVARWREHWPRILPLPHPSPRNIAWFRRHPWFEAEVVPALAARAAAILARAGGKPPAAGSD
ncbi:MAG: uracil-DNA glycosylase [Rhodothalassiaceae bacterium]|nr:MAG: uracil-DNA glycosylase [Rhodothalassiaceae bacterium]